jgi:hypothetical protein
VSRKNCGSGKISSLQDSKLGMENEIMGCECTAGSKEPTDNTICQWNRDRKLHEKQKIKRLN